MVSTPQTVVKDASLISSLNSLTSTETNGWYFHAGDYYVKAMAQPVRSDSTFKNGDIVHESFYWFKCEPIQWRVLSSNFGDYFVVSERILDARPYNSLPIGDNNYEHSEIRAWLNGGFLESAFCLDDSFVKVAAVDNSVESIGYSYNPYVCETTYDKVFLLSRAELRVIKAGNDELGFFMVPKEYDVAFLFAQSQLIPWKNYDESTGVPSLSKNAIGQIEKTYPEKKEQKAVGALFAQIDSLITLHQRK